MKRLMLPLLLGSLVSAASAAPFVVADVVVGVTSCGVLLDASAKVLVPAVAGQCKYDVASVSTGSHTVRMTAITSNDPVWGSQESAPSAPLVFVRPATPTSPTGLVLTP